MTLPASESNRMAPGPFQRHGELARVTFPAMTDPRMKGRGGRGLAESEGSVRIVTCATPGVLILHSHQCEVLVLVDSRKLPWPGEEVPMAPQTHVILAVPGEAGLRRCIGRILTGCGHHLGMP